MGAIPHARYLRDAYFGGRRRVSLLEFHIMMEQEYAEFLGSRVAYLSPDAIINFTEQFVAMFGFDFKIRTKDEGYSPVGSRLYRVRDLVTMWRYVEETDQYMGCSCIGERDPAKEPEPLFD